MEDEAKSGTITLVVAAILSIMVAITATHHAEEQKDPHAVAQNQ